MARAFASFADCVLDGVLSAAGAYGSATLGEVLTAMATRRAMHYTEDGTVQRSTTQASWRRHARRVLYTCAHLRVEAGRFAVAPGYTAQLYECRPSQPHTQSPVETLGSFRTLDSSVLNALITLAAPTPTHNPATALPDSTHDEYADMFTEQ